MSEECKVGVTFAAIRTRVKAQSATPVDKYSTLLAARRKWEKDQGAEQNYREMQNVLSKM
jgi:hypothetical protein